MTETITLDTRKCESTVGNARIAPLRRGERGNVPLVVFVRRNCRPYDLTGMTAYLVWKAADGKLVGPVPMEVTDPATGIVRCTLPDACYSTVGTARAYVELRRGAELVDTTDELGVKVLDCIDADGEQAEEYKPLIAEVREATDAAIKAAADATAAVGKANEATVAATNAATKANEVEAKLTGNILKGKDKDTFVHVDDAFPSTLLGIDIEGACKQDGTPSPDNPVPIIMVENPIFTAAGKNLLSPSKMAKTWVNYVDVDGELQVKYGDGRAWAAIPEYGVLPAGMYYICGDTIEVRRASDNATLAHTNGNVARFKLDTATSVVIKVGFANPDSQYPYVSHAMLLASSGKDVSYAPYTSKTITFTLPAEHPYLAKLPDGTADEITVDRDGNATLVARTQKVDVSNLPALSASDVLDNGLTRYYYWNVIDPPAKRDTPAFAPAFASVVDFSFQTQGMYVSGANILVGAAADPTEALKAGVYLYTTLATPVTYPLGKIEMPKAQDSIVNAWTDAEVTPNTGIEYTRDVNIVISNLESAIASITEG